MRYPYYAFSVSDPSRANPLRFNAHDRAMAHAILMNSLIDTYDTMPSMWNKEYWKEKPLMWIVTDELMQTERGL